MISSYKDLIVWQKAMDFVTGTYERTSQFPKHEIYGLTSQLRRACVSIPSNIAEGHGRNSTREYLHHLSIAYGSLCESETQIMIAQRLQYLPSESCSSLINQAAEIGRMLNGLMTSLQNKLT